MHSTMRLHSITQTLWKHSPRISSVITFLDAFRGSFTKKSFCSLFDGSQLRRVECRLTRIGAHTQPYSLGQADMGQCKLALRAEKMMCVCLRFTCEDVLHCDARVSVLHTAGKMSGALCLRKTISRRKSQTCRHLYPTLWRGCFEVTAWSLKRVESASCPQVCSIHVVGNTIFFGWIAIKIGVGARLTCAVT